MVREVLFVIATTGAAVALIREVAERVTVVEVSDSVDAVCEIVRAI